MNRSVKLALLKKALDEKTIGALGLLGLTAGGGLLLASGAGKINDAFADIRRRAGLPEPKQMTHDEREQWRNDTSAAMDKFKAISQPPEPVAPVAPVPPASSGIGGSGGSVRK